MVLNWIGGVLLVGVGRVILVGEGFQVRKRS